MSKLRLEYTRVALAEFGRIDIMVNNAGIAPVKPIHMHTPAEWDAVMNINVKSIYFSARHVVPVMAGAGRRTVPEHGVHFICNWHAAARAAYGPSKGAVIQVTRHDGIEYAR
ncbi:cyclopentanol dehydrogenase [Chloroflexota bacterium]|nr:cyclopentanol dehydrogenase [Chloroflexota bacterium]